MAKRHRKDNPHRHDHMQAAYEKAIALPDQPSMEELSRRIRGGSGRSGVGDVLSHLAALTGGFRPGNSYREIRGWKMQQRWDD